MTQTWVLVQGGAIGFLVAAAIGPIAMLCIRTTLERGRIAGIAAGMGVAVADTIYAAIGAYGISFVGAALTSGESWLKLVGGIVLIAFGIYLARKQPVSAAEEQEVPKSLAADFVMTLGLTLTNPMTILSFAGLFAGVSGLRGFPLTEIPALLIGRVRRLGGLVARPGLCHRPDPAPDQPHDHAVDQPRIGRRHHRVRALCADRAPAGLCRSRWLRS